jgi:hypothetical protein
MRIGTEGERGICSHHSYQTLLESTHLNNKHKPIEEGDRSHQITQKGDNKKEISKDLQI